MKQLGWFLLLSALTLLAGAALSLFFRPWVRDQVVLPLAYLFWVLRLLVYSIPQGVFWGVLVLIGLIVALRTIRPPQTFPVPGAPPSTTHSASRYATWLRYVSMMDSSRFAGDNLARDLIRLTVQTLAYQHSLANDEVYSRLEHEDLGLQPQLLAFVRQRAFLTQPPSQPRLTAFFRRFLPARPTHRPPGVYTPREQEAHQLISQIESLLNQSGATPADHAPEEATL